MNPQHDQRDGYIPVVGEQRPLLDVMFVKKDFAVAVGAYGAYYESTDAGAT